jgi:PAS domain S-box-containing protein
MSADTTQPRSRWTFLFRRFARVPRPLAWKMLLILGFGSTIVLGCLLGTVMLLWNLQRANQNLLALSPSLEEVMEIRRGLDSRVALYGDAVLINRRALLFDSDAERLRLAIASLNNDDELKKPQYGQIREILQQFEELYTRLNRTLLDVNYLLADGTPDTARIVWQDNDNLVERTRVVSMNLQNELTVARRILEQSIQNDINRTVAALGVITATTVFVLVGGTLFVFIFVRRTMRQIRGSLNRLAQGDLSVRLHTDHRDEIGDLANTLNRALDVIQDFVTSSAVGREVQETARYLANSAPPMPETDITTDPPTSPMPALSELFEKLNQPALHIATFIYQDNKICYISPAFHELTGYGIADLEAHDFWEVANPDDQEELKKYGTQSHEEVGSHSGLEFRLRMRDEREFWVISGFTKVTIGGMPAELCTLVDITDSRRQQQELVKAQRIESLGIIAGGIAHDFNNLLTIMVSNLSLARSNYSRNDPNLAQLLQEAEGAALRASGLTRQLLTFSKDGTPVRGVVSLSELVEETTRFVLRGAKVNYTLKLAPDLWSAEIDQGQISQVLNNLLINAVQAMPDGGDLTIRAHNLPSAQTPTQLPLAAGDYICLSVADTGTGIAPEVLGRIFDPYFTTKTKGSGLGLAVSFSIAQQHNGYLTVESEVGRGTTFYLYLPATAKKITSTSLKADLPPASKNGKILVMDDDLSIRYVVERTLTRLGYVVDTAENGTRAIELYNASRATTPYDVLILDPTIAGERGAFEVLQELRQLDPQVRAILMTGHTDEGTRARYKEYGFNGFLAKPFRLEELAARVDEVNKKDDLGRMKDE